MKKYLNIGFLGVVLSFSLSYYLAISNDNIQQYSVKMVLLSSVLGLLVLYTIDFMSKKLDTLFSWHTQTNRRLFVGFVLQMVVSFSLIYMGIYVYAYFIISQENFFVIYKNELIKLAILLGVFSIVYTVAYFVFYSYFTLSLLQIEAVKQQRKQMNLYLQVLKSQLTPHFLFNSLNIISSLVNINTKKTDLFIRKLGNMYQFIMNNYDNMFISLKEEIEFVKSYQYLLETRFEDKVKIDIDIPKNLYQTKIPPLSLQMLVENAVKHNTLYNGKFFKIEIFIERDYIVVKNDITENPKHKTSLGVGLKNINSRYVLLAKKNIQWSKGNQFCVKTPIIR